MLTKLKNMIKKTGFYIGYTIKFKKPRQPYKKKDMK